VSVTRYFTAKEVMLLANVSYRRLDYWVIAGMIQPSGRPSAGRGSRRLFTFSDLLEIRVLVRLTQCGLRLAALRSSVKQFRKRIPELVNKPLSSLRLVTDGRTLFRYLPDGETLETLDEFGQFAFAFDVGAEAVQLEKAVSSMKRPLRRSPTARTEDSDLTISL